MPLNPAIEVLNRGGLHLPEAGLWLDPHRVRDHGFVSHAHADHFANHRRLLCSEPTARLIEVRFRTSGTVQPLAWDQAMDIGPFTARLLPAGHILGSAQIHLQRRSDGASLLYTGDFKLRPGLSSEAIRSRRADTLVMETTFGVPKYRLPPTEETVTDMVKFIHETLDDGAVPILLAYSLGKAQEIHLALAAADPELNFMLYHTVAKMTRLCDELGVSMPPFEDFDADRAAGHVLIVPPNVLRSAKVQAIGKMRTAMVSGWGVDPRAKYRYRADAVFPLSDHADYDDLMRYIDLVQPQRVLTLHGFAAEFARDLRRRGIEAWSLTGDDQLELGFEVESNS